MEYLQQAVTAIVVSYIVITMTVASIKTRRIQKQRPGLLELNRWSWRPHSSWVLTAVVLAALCTVNLSYISQSTASLCAEFGQQDMLAGVSAPEEERIAEKDNGSEFFIPDPYGAGQFIHPDVLFRSDGIFAHRYWMLVTPYPWEDEEKENPCLYYSENGIRWQIPSGITNPIAAPSDDYDESAYCSDGEIAYDPTRERLLCYYVVGDRDGTEDVKLRIYNGRDVSEEINIEGVHGVSPAVLYDEATGKFHMWIVEIGHPRNIVYRYDSEDGVHYGGKAEVKQSSWRSIWHLNVMQRPGDPKVYMLARYVGNNDVWLLAANGVQEDFYLLDMEPLFGIIERPSSLQLYRSAGVFSEDGDTLKLWIPSRGTKGDWTIFSMETPFKRTWQTRYLPVPP